MREWIIGTWHWVLDFDTEVSPKKRAATLLRRAKAKAVRMEKDAVCDREAAARIYVKGKARELAEANDSRNHEIRARQQAELMARQPKCRFCGGVMEIRTRSPQGGMGCLLIVIGLCFAVFIIGIPIAIYGIVLACKTENYMACRNCGCAG